ncbi:MAG TPA: hypothetical protein VN420_00750 [Candidatus Fimivivens sp.]|nr:hypothetical protein [Candidatus Fimivivens sp.]
MSLSGNILATIAYFDAFDLPLTSFQIWKHLIALDQDVTKPESVPLGDVVAVLDDPELRGRIASRDGFFFLPGREDTVSERIRSEKVAVAKLKRVRRLASVLRLLPFVRMIGITGSLAMKKGKSDSDWDFFVVVRAGRIFTGRTILTGFLQAIRRRRHGMCIRDRACLNYFVTEDNLTIPTEDLFSANEYMCIIPLFGKETFLRFMLRNRWIARFKPDFRQTEALPLWTVPDSRKTVAVRSAFERLLDSDVLENWLGSWQKEKIMRNPNTRHEGGYIEASDRTLVFLPHPHGPVIYEKFRKRLGEVRLRG